MNYPIFFYIGTRFFCKRSLDYFSKLISWIPILGITLGTCSLIIVLSIMNGFENKLKSSILNFIPHVLIIGKYGSVNLNYNFSYNKSLNSEIYNITTITVSEVMLQSNQNIAIAMMLGIKPYENNLLTKYLVNVKQTELKKNEYHVILGKQLAKQLYVKKNDCIRIIIPTIKQFTPIGNIPVQHLLKVIGIFSSDTESDYYQILLHQHDASKLLHYPDNNFTGWRLWLKNPLNIDIIKKNILLSKDMIWKDWREQKGELFNAINMEKIVMSILLNLIIIVSLFNVISSLGELIIEKKHEIAILQTQGITNFQVMMIFLIQGIITSSIGVFIGIILGIILTININFFVPNINNIIFEKNFLPTLICIKQIITILFGTILTTLLAILYPSWYAINIHPARVLRYE